MGRAQLRSPGCIRRTGTHPQGYSMRLDEATYEQLAHGSHHSPHDYLGLHPEGKGWVLRALRPLAKSVVAKSKTKKIPLEHV
ncbi:MAG: GlgB N-terminal domain-containing protein, partial [Aquiluna sp.]